MKENTRIITAEFIENRDIIKKALKLESTYIYPIAANIFCAAGVRADVDRLRECKKIIKKNAGFASYLKGTTFTPLAAKLSIADDPEEQFGKVLAVYDILKKYFSRSEYLAMLATLLAEKTDEENAEQIASRGRALYDLMKKEHPLLTSREDNIMAGFMALSDKSDEQLIDDCEQCYDLLTKEFSSKNALQTVSHILAMTDGTPEEKVGRLIKMFDMLKKAGHKYGKRFELSALAAVSTINADVEELVETIIETDSILAEQKGYGALSIDRKTRLMHAVMLTADIYGDTDNTQAAAAATTIMIIAAQQAAMCAAAASAGAASNAG